MTRKLAQASFAPLLVYVAAAVVATWPLARHPTSLLGAPVGPGDPYLNLWILGWGMQAVLTNPVSLLTGDVFDANIFHPAAGTLAYSDHLLLQSLVLAPVYALTGNVVLCYNLLLLASLVASAMAMHLFVARTVAPGMAAYIAGMAWGFGSYRVAHLLHLQLQALYFWPLAFVLLHRLIAGRRTRDALALGVVAALQAIASVYYAVIGSLALLMAAIALMFTAARRGRGLIARRLVAAGGVALILALPVTVIYWRVQQNDGFGRNLFEASRNAAFADSYLQAPPGNLLYGWTGLLRWQSDRVGGVSHGGPERELFPGIVLAGLAVAGLLLGYRSDARPLVLSMTVLLLAGVVLSLGPDGVRPVYATLHRYVFGFQAIRAPARFAALVIFAVSTLGALGWRELSRHRHFVRRRSAPSLFSAVLAGCVVLELLHVPRTLAPAPPVHTAVGEWLRTAPGSGAVAVLPLGLDVDNTPAMVQSLEHRRALLNGYSGQRPPFYPALVDAVSVFPSDEALLALHESGVQYIVTRDPPPPASMALVMRARFEEATISELVWNAEIEARLTRMDPGAPPPPGDIPFKPGERARYAVTWDGAGANIAAGEVLVAVHAPSYRFVVTATTAPWMARFFQARDTFTTTADVMLLPVSHERDQQEGSRHVVRAFVYDRPRGVLRVGRSLSAATASDAITLPLVASARDAIATLFYLRTLPLDPGVTYQLPVNEAGRNLRLDVRVVAREPIVVQGRTMMALRIEPAIVQRVARRRSPTSVVWLSDDSQRVPVLCQVEAEWGRARVELIDYEAGS